MNNTEKDCCFTRDKNWFRYRAAGIVVEGEKVLFISDDNLDYFYTVGGGVHMGEKSEDCVRREMREETGAEYEIDHLAVIVENFFDGRGGIIDGYDCHCLEFYYLMKSLGDIKLESKSVNADGNVERLVWIPINEINKYNIKPSFLKDRIKEIIEGEGVLHIVTDVDKKA